MYLVIWLVRERLTGLRISESATPAGSTLSACIRERVVQIWRHSQMAP